MNSLDINHIKIEKANAIKLRYQKLRKVTGHFRTSPEAKLLESPPHEHKITKSLPKKQGITEDNAMMATIFASPSQVKLPKSPPHEQLITKPLPKKQGITEENIVMAAIFTASPLEDPGHHNQVIKVYHRSKSEKPRREKTETGCSSLRRSNTEVIKNLKVKVGCCHEEAGEGHYPEDHMSNEEFRKAIENFIAKQQRFLREEEEFSAIESNFDL